VLLQEVHASHHLVERTLATTIFSIAVMDLFGAVKAEPNQKVVLIQKLAPLVIKQDAVGL